MGRFIRQTTAIALIVLVPAAFSAVAAAGQEWTVKSVLKHVDKATKDVGGVVAEVHWNQLQGPITIDGVGQVQVTMSGKFRADVAGSSPRTFIGVPPTFWVHNPGTATVDVYDMFAHPEFLVQYVLLGFSPRGSDLNKLYKVKLIRESVLNDRPALQLGLTSKSKLISEAISTMHLWVDVETGLPAQLVILHTGGMQITIDYLETTRDDNLADSLFRPDWPPETEVFRHK